MKKVFALLLVMVLLLGMVGCDNNGLNGENSTFVVPKKAVTTVRVVINPAFNLYLDTKDNVVAIEPLNEDAKAIEAKLDITDKHFTGAVLTIVKVSKENGFINDESKDFTIKLVETKESGKENLLNDVIEKINDELTAANIEIEAKVDDTVFVPTGAYSIIKTLPPPYDTSAQGTRAYACFKIDFNDCYYQTLMIYQDDTVVNGWDYVIYNEQVYSAEDGIFIGDGKISAEGNIYTIENEGTGEQIQLKVNWDGTLTILKNELLVFGSVAVEKGDVLVPHIEYTGEELIDLGLATPKQ
ncbi:MAG: hypothetical protein IKU66_05115 [Clostridia bacterium]|nr:hypothetical protein [Clostridia bacterium]